MLRLSLLMLATGVVLGDIYLHNPRGSNNRLNDRTSNRRNANRLFDSQNNNRGGYNVGDLTDKAARKHTEQYNMKYFQSSSNFKTDKGRSFLTVEWTNQHGCGDSRKPNCNIVLQYMCQPCEGSQCECDSSNRDCMRNGVVVQSQRYTPRNNNLESERQMNRRRTNAAPFKGLHEPWNWYEQCYTRERNKGLFTADQNLQSKRGVSSAVHTRQNANGARSGYECPEERDYYPYWHPSPWKDIAVLAENCEYYKSKSFNVQPYGECLEFFPSGNRRYGSKHNNEQDCTGNDGTWVLMYNYLEKVVAGDKTECEAKSTESVRYIWEIPYDTKDGKTKECLVALEEPKCKPAPFSRDNHLGNSINAVPSNYTWTLPYFPSGKEQRCVVRIRYNISTDDYDSIKTDSNQNGDESPIKNDPEVTIGVGHPKLQLAINTAQFGRTFQDRSHVMILRKRPDGTENNDIYNLNVRGKRGNIVQVYPAVEYDFIPNDLKISEDDLVHIQWTGSNSHTNNRDGAAGEGTAGTDRHNMVEIENMNVNIPPKESTMWNAATVVWIDHGNKVLVQDPTNVALHAESAGYYHCMRGCSESVTTKAKLNDQLNNAPASYEGMLVKFKKGMFHYMCTRNNNFTNRSQKGCITVK